MHITPSPPGLPPSPSPTGFSSILTANELLPVQSLPSNLPKLEVYLKNNSSIVEKPNPMTPDGEEIEEDDESESSQVQTMKEEDESYKDKNQLELSPEIKPIRGPNIDKNTILLTEKRWKTNICKHWEKYKEYKEWEKDKAKYEIVATTNPKKQEYLNSFETGSIPIECKFGDSCRYAHGEDKLECAYCKKNGHTLKFCPELEGRNRFTKICQPVLTTFMTKGAGDKNTDWRLKI